MDLIVSQLTLDPSPVPGDVRQCGNTNDRSVRGFAVKPRAFGAPLLRLWSLTGSIAAAHRQPVPQTL